MKQFISGKLLSRKYREIYLLILLAVILTTGAVVLKSFNKKSDYSNEKMAEIQDQNNKNSERTPKTLQEDDLSGKTEQDLEEEELKQPERIKEAWYGDERAVDITAFQLGESTLEGDLVDVRIRYPDGEEFIVLSKRACYQLDKEEQKVTMWLREEEILRLSSSMVDAAVMEGMLYTVRYHREIEQKASKITYFPREEIQQLIKNNPNIVGEAETKLSEKLRKELEERNNHWKEKFGTNTWMHSTKNETERTEEKEEIEYVD